MKIYTILQKSSDPELEPYVLEESFDNYDDAVTAAKEAIIDTQSDYADETNIVTNKTAKGDITSFELWQNDADRWLESVEICPTYLITL